MCSVLGDYRLEKRPVPKVEDGDVLVRVLAVGICAGDAKCFAGAPYFWGKRFVVYNITIWYFPLVICI